MAAEAGSRETVGWRTVALTVGLLVLAVTVVLDAWVCDDAFITLRTVDNFVDGRGLVWNPGQRVQGYTHPLWMFLLAAFHLVTGEPYFSSLVLSAITSAAAVWIMVRGNPGALALVALLLGSRSFVDFSTSGLENPLSHLLVAVFFCRAFVGERSTRDLVLLGSVATLPRPDLGLVFAPAVGWHLYHEVRGRPRWKQLALDVAFGAAPVVMWLGFSILYYGSFVPNTALAKLNHGNPQSEVLAQGVFYLLDGLRHDPVTAVTIVAALAIPWRTRDPADTMLAAGVGMYVLYVVSVGGDFMRGRFLTVPFVASCILVARTVADTAASNVVALASVLVGLAASRPVLLPNAPDPSRPLEITNWGIADERSYYAGRTDLFSTDRPFVGPPHPWRDRGRQFNPKPRKNDVRAVYSLENVGISGYYADPEVTIVDTMALTDPLLSRLPSSREAKWRIGHFPRTIPKGYMNSIRADENKFEDEKLGELWEKLELITRGPLFDGQRLAAIWDLNLHGVDQYVDWSTYRYGEPEWLVLSELLDRSLRGRLTMEAGGVVIELDRPFPEAGVEVGLSHGIYRAMFLRDGSVVHVETVLSAAHAADKDDKRQSVPLAPVYIPAPPDADHGSDMIRLLPATRARPFVMRRFVTEGRAADADPSGDDAGP